MTVALRRAVPTDAAFLARLVADDDVRPYLAVVRPSTEEEIAAAIAAANAEPAAAGVMVVERDGAAVGTVAFACVNRRSRIAERHSLAIAPEARAGGTARHAVALLLETLFGELGFHRVECEVYGFNARAAAFVETVGFVAEGARRQAYLREDGWVDGLRFGLLADEPRRAPGQ